MIIPKRKHRNPLIPTTSMGDIAFQLIIFFMVTSNFIREAHVEMKPATSPDVEKLKESQISVSMDRDGKLWLQGKICEAAALEGSVRELAKNRGKKIVVMLKIDKDIPHEKYGEVLMSLSKAEVEMALVGELRR